MNTYQALFLVLLIFALGDVVGAVTHAKVSSMFVIMCGFLFLFLSGIFPADICDTAHLTSFASISIQLLLVNMGSSVNVRQLMKEWRTVACASLAMAAAILGCILAAPIIGFEYALAAAPVINGGVVATNSIVEATQESLPLVAALATFIYATQKFVGTLPCSNCGIKFAQSVVDDLRAKKAADPTYSFYSSETAGTGTTTVPFWKKHERLYTNFNCLAISAAVAYVAYLLGQATHGWIGQAIWSMLLGIFLQTAGIIPPNLLRDKSRSVGFFSFLALVTIVPSLAKIQLAQIPLIGFKVLVAFIFTMLLTYALFYLTPAWKVAGSKELSIGIGMCQMIGYPGTQLIADEIALAVGKNQEEIDAIQAKIGTAYVISGFTSVTILSVFIANIVANVLA